MDEPLALNLHFPYLFSLVENKAFKVADAGKWSSSI